MVDFTSKLFNRTKQATTEFCEFLKIAKIPGNDIEEIDQALQARFFQKNADGSPKERWELAEVDAPALKELWEPLRSIGMIDAVFPPPGSYEGSLVLGALLPRVDPRYRVLSEAIAMASFDSIFLLGGKRSLQLTDPNDPTLPGKESMKDMLYPSRFYEIRDNWEFWPKQKPATELDMMRFRWEIIDIPLDLRALPVHCVDAPMKEGPDGAKKRPITEDTIDLWLKDYAVDGKTYLAASQMPYAPSQDIAIRNRIRKAGRDVQVITIGLAAGVMPLPVGSYMRELAGWVHRLVEYHSGEDEIEHARRRMG